VELREWLYTTPASQSTGVWAAGLADLVDYQQRRTTRHDILERRGRRVQRGTCNSDPPPQLVD
jgi:hypothetical protein